MEIRHQLWEGMPGNGEYQQDSEWPIRESKNVHVFSVPSWNTDPFLEGTNSEMRLCDNTFL